MERDGARGVPLGGHADPCAPAAVRARQRAATTCVESEPCGCPGCQCHKGSIHIYTVHSVHVCACAPRPVLTRHARAAHGAETPERPRRSRSAPTQPLGVPVRGAGAGSVAPPPGGGPHRSAERHGGAPASVPLEQGVPRNRHDPARVGADAPQHSHRSRGAPAPQSRGIHKRVGFEEAPREYPIADASGVQSRTVEQLVRARKQSSPAPPASSETPPTPKMSADPPADIMYV